MPNQNFKTEKNIQYTYLTLCDPWTVAWQAPLSMAVLQERILG